MNFRTLGIAASLVAPVLCVSRRIQGAGPAPPDNNVTAKQIYEATQNPNLTSFITFNFTHEDMGGAESFVDQWTWRVNITQISLSALDGPPFESSMDTSNLDDPSFINTGWDFSWLGKQDLGEYLSEATKNASGNANRLCMDPVTFGSIKPDVSNSYREEDNGDCTNVFGKECLDAVMAQVQPLEPQREGREIECSAADIDFASIPQCASTIGQGITDFYYEIGNGQNVSNRLQLGSEKVRMASSVPFFANVTDYFDGTNSTLLEEKNQEIQAVLLRGATANRLLCQKVNKAVVSVAQNDGQGEGEEGRTENAGVPTTMSVAVFAVAMLTAPFILL